MKKIIIAIAVLLVVSGNGVSQTPSRNRASQDNCETIYGAIELAANRIRGFSDMDSVIVVLAGSPNGKSNRYDHLRISRLVKFLVNHGDAKSEQIVWGIGPPSEHKFSYMRFYTDGKLLIELTLNDRTLLCNGDGEALPQ